MEAVYQFRVAEPGDGPLLLEWANDPLVRKQSFSQEQIAEKEHMEWFASCLQSQKCRIYLFCENETPIGQVRVDIDEEATIHYSVSAAYRKRGLGREMLQRLEGQLRKDYPQIRILVAHVKADNDASARLFRNLGYKEQPGEVLHFYKTLAR